MFIRPAEQCKRVGYDGALEPLYVKVAKNQRGMNYLPDSSGCDLSSFEKFV